MQKIMVTLDTYTLPYHHTRRRPLHQNCNKNNEKRQQCIIIGWVFVIFTIISFYFQIGT